MSTRHPIGVPLFCPECGGRAPDNAVAGQLSALGYVHDDQQHECSDCGHTWTHGVPVGNFDGGDDLECRVCRHDPDADQQYYRVHRVVPADESSTGDVQLHLKCPRCWHFTTVWRETGDRGLALVGYPDITGSTDDAESYGYPEDTE